MLKRNPKEFIEKQENYDLDADDVVVLLEASEFSKSDKVSIIQNVLIENEKLIIESKNLSNAVCNTFSSDESIDFGYDVLISLMSFGDSIENRVKILTPRLDGLSREEITDLLSWLGKPYSNVSKIGKKPQYVPNTPYNLALIKKLDEIRYISTHREKGDEVKINTRAVER